MPDVTSIAAHVFVYGTLKEGFPNAHINQGARLPGTFRTCERFPLFLVGDRRVPCMMANPGQGEQVYGQVFAVNAQTLAAMDTLERVDDADGYRRLSIAVCDVHALVSDTDRAQLSVDVYLKPLASFDNQLIRLGPINDYTLEHAAQYRPR